MNAGSQACGVCDWGGDLTSELRHVVNVANKDPTEQLDLYIMTTMYVAS